ncbi:uncharacterized protein MEPE_02144 [Melanopsichium pennsylvanicum]|uniref:Uncharacterized protein n=2 Tax=Melanopsichium pennsylvanicum TaxID=63383 RepID=A0AAJ4XJC1_9BASI|nr:putative protein [Melanopsichium pennsylvanicum 4]SNX83437.1 uncharacterized protein MEPE_02144 [Melanopsichium pennsylvanicum]
MVTLSRSSLYSGSVGVGILPRVSIAQQPAASSSQPCCYNFDLTIIPQGACLSLNQDLQRNLSELFTLSQLLAIPTLFGRADGQAWIHSEEHYPALHRWKEQLVPTLLSRVAQLLDRFNTNDTSDLTSEADLEVVNLVLGHVVCAVARYIPSPFAATLFNTSSDLADVPEMPQDDTWTSATSQTEARKILCALNEMPAASIFPKRTTIAKSLLVDYIKPIFCEVASASSSSITSSIDADTGRKKSQSNDSLFVSRLDFHLGHHRFESAAEDNDASNLAPRKFAVALSEDLRASAAAYFGAKSEEREYSVRECNEALGCVNVLGWCLDNLELKSEGDWSGVWPLTVPPLLTLLEHPEPRFRLRGTLLVHKLLLRPSTGDKKSQDQSNVRRQEISLGKILLRTGIGSLLERALHINLTYIHNEAYAPALLSHSIGALHQLIVLTTHPVAYRLPGQDPFEAPSIVSDATDAGLTLDQADDCGQRRMQALFKLVSESILSTWSYLPLPPSSTRLGRELVIVTCDAYLMLAEDLAAPALGAETSKALGGMARFLDVTIDWIFRSWVSNIAFDHTDQISITVKVVAFARRLLFPLTDGTKLGSQPLPAGPVRRFTSLILSSIAKCWISALESPLRSSATQTEAKSDQRWKQLEQSLATFMARLSHFDLSVAPRWAELVGLEKRLEVLLPC